jgi:hypothetical protein
MQIALSGTSISFKRLEQLATMMMLKAAVAAAYESIGMRARGLRDS